MIRVDTGGDLHELLIRARRLGDCGRLDIAVPFFDADSRLWRQMAGAAQDGSRVRVLTRPAVDAIQALHFEALERVGVRLVYLPRVHAKSVLLSDRRGRQSMGWIGSHNFTKASENTAQELGVVFSGDGSVEVRLMQQALLQMEAWSRDAKLNRKPR